MKEGLRQMLQKGKEFSFSKMGQDLKECGMKIGSMERELVMGRMVVLKNYGGMED